MISANDKAGFEVTVHRVGGKAFNEYDVEHAPAQGLQPASSSCWLESEAEAAFDIKITVTRAAQLQHGSPDMVAVIYVDGRLIRRQCVHTGVQDCRFTVSTMQFQEDGVMYEGQLKFATLRTTDDDAEVTLSGDQLQSLGKIRVDFVRGKLGARLDCPMNYIVEPDVGIAAEKSKKLGGSIGYTQKKVLVPKTKSTEWRAIDSESLPYFRLDFNYRTRPVLQLLGVVEQDETRARVVTPPILQARRAQAGPSRKRKAEVIDIDADDEKAEIKPDNKEILATRVSWLERQLQNARKAIKRQKGAIPVETVDLTGDD